MSSSGGASVMFIYDGDGKRVLRIETGFTTTVFIGGIYELNVTSGLTTTYYFANGKLIAERRGGAVYFLQGDQLGSISLTTDSAGWMTSFVRYKPFGLTRDTTGVLPTDFGYTSQRFEANTGYIYDHGARYYDPYVGRFISADTAVPGATNPQLLNRYGYVLNSPLSHRDPSGHCIEDLCIVEIAVAAAVVEVAAPIVEQDAPLIQEEGAQLLQGVEQLAQSEVPKVLDTLGGTGQTITDLGSEAVQKSIELVVKQITAIGNAADTLKAGS